MRSKIYVPFVLLASIAMIAPAAKAGFVQPYKADAAVQQAAVVKQTPDTDDGVRHADKDDSGLKCSDLKGIALKAAAASASVAVHRGGGVLKGVFGTFNSADRGYDKCLGDDGGVVDCPPATGICCVVGKILQTDEFDQAEKAVPCE